MGQKSAGKQLTINLAASIISFAVNVGINFFLTPYLVGELGNEAYGFIGLANNFVQYANIITVALNSIAGRFISIEYHKKNIDKASKIFSSVLVADLIIAAVMLVAATFVTLFIDSIVNVPPQLVSSVKLTFAITFATFILSVITAIFTTAAFVKNRLDINSVRDIIANLFKAALVILLFALLPAKLYYLAAATLASGFFLLAANITVKKRILPEVKINIKKFSFRVVKTLLMAGVWLSFSQLCNVLMTGLDLLICNLTLGAAIMGIFSIAKTVPVCLGNLIVTIGNVFTPHFTILYAKKKIDELVEETKFSGKIMNYIMVVPLAGFIAFGNQFYTLWQPTKSPDEILMIQIISILTCLTYLFSCMTQCHMMLFTVCNRLKIPVLTNFIIGVGSVAVVLAALNFGNFGDAGVYVIAGVSSALLSIRSITFVPMYSAYILGQKKTVFLPSVARGILTFAVILTLFSIVSSFVVVNSWLSLLTVISLAGAGGYIVALFLLFSRKELEKLKGKFLKKLKKG